MSDEINTPPGLEPDSDGVNEWVRFQLIKIHSRLKAVEKFMEDCINQQRKVDEFIMKTEIRLTEGVSTFKSHSEHFQSIDKQIEELRKIRNNPKNNSITFQWVLEKLALPVIMFLIGGAIALLFK